MREKKVELLSPAGSLEGVAAALNFGADAVYMGGPLLQLRAEAAGFDEMALQKAIEQIHTSGKRAYITVNSFAKDREIDRVGDYACRLKELGADALIISDLGVLTTVHRACPEMEIHVSTQANCLNYATAMTYYELSARRIVLGREMSLAEIAELHSRIPGDLELEVFVHGAMCMAYSGRCLLSSFFNDRSANRGDCTQPCRWNYHLVEQTRPDVFIPVEEDENGSAILSSHDLNCLAFLDELANAGVDSFKIEGRMKSPYYVATVTNAYRHAIDGTGEQSALLAELETISHRPYSDGFYFGRVKEHHHNEGAYSKSCIFLGVVLDTTRDGYITIEARNKICVGDWIEVLSPYAVGQSFQVEEILEDGVSVGAANCPMKHFNLRCPYPLHPGDYLRKRL